MSLDNFKNSTKSAADNNYKFINATQITWADYSASPESYASGNYIICGYNACDAFYKGVHKEDNNPCVINCSQCNTYGVAEESPEHNISRKITYSSFDVAGIKITGCVNKGCTHNTQEEAPALFVCLGFSVYKTGNCGMALGYMINSEAAKEYTEITGEALNYGVFAASQSRLGDKDIINADGSAAGGAICVETSKFGLAAFEIKITGFKADAQKEAMLALGAYVVTNDGETTKVYYLQNGTPNEGEKYCFTSYKEQASE